MYSILHFLHAFFLPCTMSSYRAFSSFSLSYHLTTMPLSLKTISAVILWHFPSLIETSPSLHNRFVFGPSFFFLAGAGVGFFAVGSTVGYTG